MITKITEYLKQIEILISNYYRNETSIINSGTMCRSIGLFCTEKSCK